MKNLKIIVFLCICVSSLQAQRTQQLINFDWKHQFGEIPDASKTDFNDARWTSIQLPHDASIAGPFYKDSINSDKKNGFRPRRKGWYRKSLVLPETAIGKKIFLEFEGIYRDAKIYVNEKEVGHQLNGYEGFMVDITSVAKQGNNTLAVSYDNTDKNSSRWYNGEGIYRDVWLITTDSVHVAYNGTYVYTPFVTNQKAVVNMETEITNETVGKKPVTVKSIKLSPDGKKVGEITNVIPVYSNETYICKQNISFENPQLWELDNPNLYKLQTTLWVDQKEIDSYTTQFGIRTIEFTREQGLLLNGKKVFVQGVNIHHDLGPLGAAAFERGFERRLEGLKKLGCNGIRLSHNPHDKAILEWCDRNGVLIYAEAFDKWDSQFFGKGNSFEDHWRASLEAFIKRDRNHPCVFIWSVGNEVSQQRKSEDYGVGQLKEMVDFVHKLEPSRQVTCGLFPARANGKWRTDDYFYLGPPEMEFYMDVQSTNYREEFWPVDRKQYPQLKFILSEASVSNYGNEWFNLNHHTSVGMFYWGGVSYIGESFGWPNKGWRNAIIDWNDHWNGFSYYIQSLFTYEPLVHATVIEIGQATQKLWNAVNLTFQPMTSHWNWVEGDTITLLTPSNCQEVELFINGKSLGNRKVPEAYFTKDITSYSAEEYDPENPILKGPEIHKPLEWDVPYQPGKVKVVGKIDGKIAATYEMETAGEAYQIILEADREQIKANGLDLSYITVKVVDKNGIIVPGAEHNISFSVKGAGVNQAVGNANVMGDELFVSDHRKVFKGKALLVVRSTRESGTILITATAKGLKKGILKIESI